MQENQQNLQEQRNKPKPNRTEGEQIQTEANGRKYHLRAFKKSNLQKPPSSLDHMKTTI